MNDVDLQRLLDRAMPDRVYSGIAPMGTPEPYVAWSLVTGNVRNTLVGDAHCTLMLYRIDSYALTRAEARRIMDHIFALVDECGGDPTLDERQDFYEQETRIYRVSVVLSTSYEPDEVQS